MFQCNLNKKNSNYLKFDISIENSRLVSLFLSLSLSCVCGGVAVCMCVFVSFLMLDKFAYTTGSHDCSVFVLTSAPR